METNRITPDEVIAWAQTLLEKCDKELTSAERKEQQKYATLIRNPKDKIFLSRLLDESSQIRNNKKLARRIKYMIDKYGVPEFFSSADSMLLRAYQWGGYLADFAAVPIFKKRVRNDTSTVIIDQSRPNLTKHLAMRYTQGIGQNVNLLGEVVVGNGEADNRYEHYLHALTEPDINYISIKISGIYAQLHPLNFREAREELIARLSTIYRAAKENKFCEGKGGSTTAHKFVNLDMEEYKDMHLTLEVFIATLDKEEFKDLEAGIVVQTYLPDAEWLLGELLRFAHRRVESGGAPIKVRLVKGANLQMESVISSLRGWENPVLGSKVESDANYLKMLDIALQPENAKVMHVGVASHNLFTIGYAYLLAQRNETTDYVSFEMLEGMANNLVRAMSGYGAKIVLYTPVVSDKHFLNAVSYLVRRLDENTGEDNFLSYSFNLKADGKEWEFLSEQFKQGYDLKSRVSNLPTRTQDRREGYTEGGIYDGTFRNEADTNFDLEANKRWAEGIVTKWQNPELGVIPLQIGSEERVTENRHIYYDRVQRDTVSYEMSMAGGDDIDRIVDTASEDVGRWAAKSIDQRVEILRAAGDNIASRRGDLIGVMCSVTSKTITEGDVEISEAIDFCRFYPHSMAQIENTTDGVSYSPQGVVVVISPWNFPLAIPVGGVAAALSSGNRVILKPATVAAPVMWETAKCFWDAGVPKEALQVIITDGREPLTRLTTSPKVNHIILTGGTDTAQKIARSNPAVRLSAETGGKNAMIITSSADRDKAIINAVSSAFGNAGQKCSACSLLLVEGDVFDDPTFKEKLKDATLSLKVGSPWDLGTVVGPMITNENDKLLHSINDPKNSKKWLVAPRFLDNDGYILAPTILWDVRPEDFEFKTELFAPLLSVVRFNGLQEAIAMVNSSDYGLTSGIQSLDENEIELWKENIVAGNLYINRGITGAIVNRQPFGGMKLSAFGGGIKAGGSNYVLCFVDARCDAKNDDYQSAYDTEFSRPRDVNNLYGEQNIFRYLPLSSIALRVLEDDTVDDIALCIKAANICGTPITVSIDSGDDRVREVMRMGCVVKEQNLWEFIADMPNYERMRTINRTVPRQIYEAAAGLSKYVASAPLIRCGRIELLNYLQEQSISQEYHRYGSITEVPEI